MVKDVRSLGYMYAPPVDSDYVPSQGYGDGMESVSVSEGGFELRRWGGDCASRAEPRGYGGRRSPYRLQQPVRTRQSSHAKARKAAAEEERKEIRKRHLTPSSWREAAHRKGFALMCLPTTRDHLNPVLGRMRISSGRSPGWEWDLLGKLH